MSTSLKRNLHPAWLKVIQSRQPDTTPNDVPAPKLTINPALSFLIAMKQETPPGMGARHPGVDMTGWEVEQMPSRPGGPAIVRKRSANLPGWARLSVHPGDPRYPSQIHHQ